jgi:hypothetical protein
MNYSSEFIVQYVGFQTAIDKNNFAVRWTPFANQFKSMGIKTIDLYEVAQPNDINFVSRNVWTSQTYLKNFPTGVAGSGGGGGISVYQFGGYWLDEDQLERDDEMELVFLNSAVELADDEITLRSRATENVPYKQLLDFSPAKKMALPASSVKLVCNHIKQM